MWKYNLELLKLDRRWWAGSRYVGGRMEREAADGTERGYCEVVTSVADVACGYVGKLES